MYITKFHQLTGCEYFIHAYRVNAYLLFPGSKCHVKDDHGSELRGDRDVANPSEDSTVTIVMVVHSNHRLVATYRTLWSNTVYSWKYMAPEYIDFDGGSSGSDFFHTGSTTEGTHTCLSSVSSVSVNCVSVNLLQVFAWYFPISRIN